MSAIDAAPAAMASLLATMSSLGFGTLGDLLLRTRVRRSPSIDKIDTCDAATSIFFSLLSTKRSTLRASAIVGTPESFTRLCGMKVNRRLRPRTEATLCVLTTTRWEFADHGE